MNTLSKIILSFFFLISFLFNSIILKAHNYIPIPEDSTVRWIMIFQYFDPGVCEETYLFNYRITGDTSINGMNYKKVNIENNLFIQNTAGIHGCGNPINGYIYAFRQDTVLKKCYLIPRDSINEQLIYDFSLQVNDTLSNPYFKSGLVIACQDSIPTLHSLDSVLIDNQYHLIQNIYCGDKVIEGIGWLTDPFMFGLTFYHLVCMKKDTSLLFLDPTYGFYCNWFPINIKSPENKSTVNFNISTITNEIQIECGQVISKIETFDLTGRKIFAADIQTSSFNLETFSFPDFIIMKVYLKDNTIIIKKLFLKQ